MADPHMGAEMSWEYIALYACAGLAVFVSFLASGVVIWSFADGYALRSTFTVVWWSFAAVAAAVMLTGSIGFAGILVKDRLAEGSGQ